MRKHSVDEAIDIGNTVTGITSILIGAAVALAVGVVLVKLLWTWTVPDLFPAAVDQGLITRDLTWLAAMKAVALVAIVSSTGGLVAGRWGRQVSST
jgi:hypothetical protein